MALEFEWLSDDDKVATHRCRPDKEGSNAWVLLVRRVSDKRTASWEYLARWHHYTEPPDEWTGKYYRTKGDAMAAVERIVRDHASTQ